MGIVLQAMPGNLHACLSQAKAEIADYVVIDTPPHVGGVIDAAIRAADLVIIPIPPGPFDIKAAAGTVEILEHVGRPGLFVLSQVAAAGPDNEARNMAIRRFFKRARRQVFEDAQGSS